MDYMTSVYDRMPDYDRKKARYTAFFMAILVLYIIPAIILDSILGSFTITGLASSLAYYGIIALLFLFLKRGHIHFVTNVLMIAGFVKALEYFFIVEAFVFYVHIALALLMAAAIHVRKYQLYISYFLFNGLLILRIPFILPYVNEGIISQTGLMQTIQTVFGSLFITFTIHFLSGIIDREIEESVKLEKIASTDTLTGLANRRKLENFFRQPGLFGYKILLVLDIDYFKRVNDDFGHERGDEVLVLFASILSSALRDSDTCYRWGGEEFVAVLKDISLDEAKDIAERLRQTVEKSDFGIGRPMTVSIGMTGSLGESEALEPMLARADKALYLAKEMGRNRIEVEQS